MSSVTFPTAIGGDGSTVTDDDNATTGLRNGGWRTRFIPCFTNLVNIADYVVTYTASTTAFATPPPIGSTTPNTGAFTRVTVTGSTAPANGIYLPGTNSLGFATNSSERVRIDASGNVAIGASAASSGLQVEKSYSVDTVGAASKWTARFKDTSAYGLGKGGSLLFIGVKSSGGSGGNFAGIAGLKENATDNNGQGYLAFYTTPSTGVITERMRLDSSGNLGLGVTPTTGWEAGTALQLGNNYSYTKYGMGRNYYYDGSANRYITSAASGTYQISGGGAHVWSTAASGTAGNAISFTQAMTLDASGNLLVGKTASGALNVGFQAFPSGESTAVTSSATTGSGPLFYLTNAAASVPNGYRFISFRSTSSFNEIGTITQLSSTTVAYNTLSDQRLKTNVEPAGSAIKSILDFPVDQFDWISTGEHQDFGAVAQKVINVIPEMVSAPADEDAMWGIDWSKAVPRLIKTIQELSSQVSDLKAELNELKAKVNA
jgi:hypothetical protein